MRLYELAFKLALPVSDAIDLVRREGEWVASHLSSVAEPIAQRLLERVADAPAIPLPPLFRAPQTLAPPSDSRGSHNFARQATIGPRVPRSRRRYRHRPGPRRITFKDAPRDDYDNPVENLRYEVELPTGDVAELLGVAPATVRKWVARGYITPVGKIGPSHLFNTQEVISAFQEIEGRRRATGATRDSYRPFQPTVDIPSKFQHRMLTVTEAATVVGVSASTIRSWIHRGHIDPLPSSSPRRTLLRLGSVVTAARMRQLSTQRPASRRRR